MPIEFFVGRVSEIERLRSLAQAATLGRFSVGFAAGERGIGKSSLVSFVRHLTEREDGIVGAYVFLDVGRNTHRDGTADLRPRVKAQRSEIVA